LTAAGGDRSSGGSRWFIFGVALAKLRLHILARQPQRSAAD
jgi:hypothetical protein